MFLIKMALPLFMILSFAIAEDSNTFYNATAGIKITKPDGWRFVGLDDVQKNREKTNLEDKNVEEGIKKRTNAPLIVMTKYAEPFDGLNPSVQILIRPLGNLIGKSSADILQMILPALQKSFKDMKIKEEVHETVVGGLKGAGVIFEYVLKTTDGKEFAAQSRMYTVTRNSFMIQVGIGLPNNPSKEIEKEISNILTSLTIEKGKPEETTEKK